MTDRIIPTLEQYKRIARILVQDGSEIHMPPFADIINSKGDVKAIGCVCGATARVSIDVSYERAERALYELDVHLEHCPYRLAVELTQASDDITPEVLTALGFAHRADGWNLAVSETMSIFINKNFAISVDAETIDLGGFYATVITNIKTATQLATLVELLGGAE